MTIKERKDTEGKKQKKVLDKILRNKKVSFIKKTVALGSLMHLEDQEAISAGDSGSDKVTLSEIGHIRVEDEVITLCLSMDYWGKSTTAMNAMVHITPEALKSKTNPSTIVISYGVLMGILEGDAYTDFILAHELGHIHHKHLINTPKFTYSNQTKKIPTDNIDKHYQQHASLLLSGGYNMHEYQADLYAMSVVTSSKAIFYRTSQLTECTGIGVKLEQANRITALIKESKNWDMTNLNKDYMEVFIVGVPEGTPERYSLNRQHIIE